MNVNEIIIIPKECKVSPTFSIGETQILLPKYVVNSISRYRFLLYDDKIFLQRKCNKCNNFFSVQEYIDGSFKKIDNPSMRYLGTKSGFHNTCASCEIINTSPVTHISQLSNKTADREQLNIVIDADLKDYYKIIAIKNRTSLKTEVINALTYYKNNVN